MRIPAAIKEALDSCGVPYEIRHGKKHQKIFIADKMVGVFALNSRKQSKHGRRR